MSLIDGSRLGCTSLAACPIPLVDDTPINLPQYRLSHVDQEVVNKEVQLMLDLDVIEPSVSPWNSPVLLVTKKDGSKRFCADLRRINDRTVKDVYPIPHIQDTLDRLAGHHVFSTLDLKSGYWQLEIPIVDRPKTAFSTTQGHFQWKRAPFGFCNMPSIFQRMMHTLFQDCQTFLLVYLDDLVIFSATVHEHYQHLTTVFDRLLQANLTVHLKKCHFLATMFLYLGHLIHGNTIKPNPDKVSALRQLAPPTNRQQLLHFVGLINWFKRFIPNLAQHAACLYQLTSKSAIWNWTVQHQDAFQHLKNVLASAPVVHMPDFQQPFILMCDASDVQIAAVLLQQHDATLVPIHYHSRVLNVHERNYSVTEKECLAIVDGIKTFHTYLHGRQFIVRTDHKALVWLYKTKNQFSKLLRWSILLQEYQFLIVYGKGPSNTLADALSRLTRNENIPVNESFEPTPSLQMSNSQLQHTTLVSFWQDTLWLIQCAQSKWHPPIRSSEAPRNQNWIGRQVQVLGSWFTGAFGKAHKKELFTMDVVKFNPGKQLKDDRWIVCLHEDGQPDQEFAMNYNAMCRYMIPLQQQVQPSLTPPTTTPNTVVQLPCDLPTLDTFISEQAHDSTFRIWFEWCQSHQTPDVKHPQYLWWSADKDVIFFNEVQLLCRYATIAASVEARKCIQVLVPESLRSKVLHYIHGSEIFGHQGFARSLFHLRTQFFWSNMRDSLLTYIQSCPCQGLKHVQSTTAVQHDTISSPSPNYIVAADCCGPFPVSSSNNTHILVLQDLFTRFTELVPLPNLTADVIIEIILNVWILRYGPMHRLLTDNGSEFANKTLLTVCNALSIKKVFITPLHPQSNGQVERFMQTLKRLIASQLHLFPNAWDIYLPRLQYIYNTSMHAATLETPYFLWFARIPASFQALVEDLQQPDPKIPLSLAAFKSQLIHHLVSTSMEVATYAIQHHPDPPVPASQIVWQVGDLVWLQDKSQTAKVGSRKLANTWLGPYLILEVYPSRTIKLLCPSPQIPRHEVKVSVDRIRRFVVPFYQPWMDGHLAFRYPLFILEKRLRHGNIMYRVQWLSLADIQPSWESSDSLPPQLVFNFERQLISQKLPNAKPRLPLFLENDLADNANAATPT